MAVLLNNNVTILFHDQVFDHLLFPGKKFGVTDFINPGALGDKTVSQVGL